MIDAARLSSRLCQAAVMLSLLGRLVCDIRRTVDRRTFKAPKAFVCKPPRSLARRSNDCCMLQAQHNQHCCCLTMRCAWRARVVTREAVNRRDGVENDMPRAAATVKRCAGYVV